MTLASEIISPDARQRIDAAVASAEAKTSAEIVPVVATASDDYDRAEDIVGLWVGLVLMAIVWFFAPHTDPTEPGSWATPIPQELELAALMLAVIVGYILGAILAARIGRMRRPFVPRRQMHDAVATRARQVFFDLRVHHTARQTGLLIYVSLFERVAAVLGDEAILEQLGQSALDELCTRLTEELRRTDVATAITATIDAAAARLATALPAESGDTNELKDALVVID
jgi:putative membrane protein